MTDETAKDESGCVVVRGVSSAACVRVETLSEGRWAEWVPMLGAMRTRCRMQRQSAYYRTTTSPIRLVLVWLVTIKCQSRRQSRRTLRAARCPLPACGEEACGLVQYEMCPPCDFVYSNSN